VWKNRECLVLFQRVTCDLGNFSISGGKENILQIPLYIRLFDYSYRLTREHNIFFSAAATLLLHPPVK
jgi:hypothetical protein